MLIRTNIIFLYADSMRRDLSTCYILEEILNERGFKTFICSRRNFLRYLKFVTPKKLFIVGQVDMFYQQSIRNAAKSDQVEVFFMPAEGFASEAEYVNMYPQAIDYSFIRSIFFWGENSLEWFKKNRNVNDLKVLKRAGYARLPIARAYRAIGGRDRKKIGFIGRFAALNDIYKRNLLGFYVSEKSAPDRSKLMARQDCESRAINCYIELFDFIVNNTDFRISLRPHPNEDVTTYRKLTERFGDRFEIDRVFDVAEWMASCHAIVGMASSSFIDAHEVQAPVICIDNYLDSQRGTLHYDPALEWMYESCHLPDSLDGVKALLMTDNLQPVATEKFKTLLAGDFCGDSDIVFDSIVSEILKKPCNPKSSDGALLLLLRLADFLLASVHHLRRNNALQFDFSKHYHPISAKLENVSAAIRRRVNLVLPKDSGRTKCSPRTCPGRM